MPNIHRSVLRRRRILQSGGIVALGAVATALTGRRFFSAPPSSARIAAPLDPVVIPDFSRSADDTLVGSTNPGKHHPAPASESPPQPLSHEEEYARFIASLDLRFLTASEIIDPHRGIYGGVANQLPPRSLWNRIAPTLKVADEIRQRLDVPLLRITSAYRRPEYNRQIPGAASRSFHVRNQALDLVFACPAQDAAQVARTLRNERFFRGGLGIYPSFIHIDTRGYNANWNG
jgi:hypothetical protein